MSPNKNNSSETRSYFSTWYWKLFGALTILLAAFGSFNLATAIVDRDPPISYISRSAVTETVPQGGVLEVEFALRRDKICKSELYRWLVDSQQNKHAISSYTASISLNLGYISDRRSITIPLAASLGQAKYYTEIRFYCNWLQSLIDWPIVLGSPPISVEITPYVDPATLLKSEIKKLGASVQPMSLGAAQRPASYIPLIPYSTFGDLLRYSPQSPFYVEGLKELNDQRKYFQETIK